MTEADYIAQIIQMAQESFALARARVPASEDSMTEADFLARITETARQAYTQGEAKGQGKNKTHAAAQEPKRADQQVIDELDQLSYEDPALAVTAPRRASRN